MHHGIQGLRFGAAALVVLHHAVNRADRAAADDLPETLTYLGAMGSAGVHVFFVISGLVMAISLSQTGAAARGADAATAFLRRRAWRIYPAYLAAALLTLALDPWLGLVVADGAARVTGALALVPGMADGILYVGWTLGYELYFYAILAATLALPRAAGAAVLVGVLGVLPFLLATLVPDPQVPPLRVAASPILAEFLLGYGLGRLLPIARARLAAWPGRAAGIPTLVAGVGAAAVGLGPIAVEAGIPQMAVYGPAGAALTLGLALRDGRAPGPVARATAWAGGWSYSLYLAHLLPIAAIERAIALDLLSWEVGLTAMIAGAAACGWLLHRAVEAPARATRGAPAPQGAPA